MLESHRPVTVRDARRPGSLPPQYTAAPRSARPTAPPRRRRE
ncbi:hypothetical protein [Streptomyces sp. NRRL F-4489]|nr:hypothetical protein [Streptomyces sp. NRRL F-4489]